MSFIPEAINVFSTVQPAAQLSSGLNQILLTIKLIISICGTLAIFIGALLAIYRYIIYRFTHLSTYANLNGIRLDLARTIVLGLEFFVASDVIETTITPDFAALGILIVLVIIRTILNFSLHKEIKELSEIPGSGVVGQEVKG